VFSAGTCEGGDPVYQQAKYTPTSLSLCTIAVTSRNTQKGKGNLFGRENNVEG